jgi:hypothetical protein
LDKLSQIASNNDDGEYDDEPDEEYDDGEYDDEPDEEYDDGEYDDEIDPDGPKEDVLLPKIWDLVGEKTPDDGNEPVDDSEETSTVDSGGEDGVTQDDEWTVDLDGDEGAASNEMTIDEGEWTVDLERVVEIVTEHNVKLGEMLQRVVERTFASGTTESDGTVENDIVGVVVEGEGGSSAGTTAENNIVDNIVLTAGEEGTVENDVVVLTDSD